VVALLNRPQGATIAATTSMGRLTLNILLSFAQFEREVIGERVRDKIAGLNG
jgi:DNA invertase Pin-like site-specific DNA recombinase